MTRKQGWLWVGVLLVPLGGMLWLMPGSKDDAIRTAKVTSVVTPACAEHIEEPQQ